MKQLRKLGVCIVLCVVAMLIVGASRPNDTADINVAKTATELDRKWLAAGGARDTQFLEKLFADNFTELNANGQVVNKAQQIKQITAAATKIEEIYPEDIVIRYTAPNIAILTDTTTIKGVSDGHDISGKYRVLRVFVKKDGEWQAAGAGLTRIEETKTTN